MWQDILKNSKSLCTFLVHLISKKQLTLAKLMVYLLLTSANFVRLVARVIDNEKKKLKKKDTAKEWKDKEISLQTVFNNISVTEVSNLPNLPRISPSRRLLMMSPPSKVMWPPIRKDKFWPVPPKVWPWTISCRLLKKKRMSFLFVLSTL